MRRALVIAGLLGFFATLAGADPTDLTGGALITHNAGYWERYHQPTCATYYQYSPISSCEEQNNTMDTGEYAWFVIAAFDEDKEWCGVQFGFGDYNPGMMVFYEWSPCAPGGFLELPSADWPGPLEGTAFVTIENSPWSGNWIPVYWFHVYSYAAYGPGVVQLIPDPSAGVHFAGFANCLQVPETFDAFLGGMGVGQPGTWVCPNMEDFVCCVGEGCVIVHSEAECLAMGGEYHPEWHDCGPPDPCGTTPATRASWGQIKSMYR